MQQDLITGVRFFGASALVILSLVVAFVSRGKTSSRAYDSARWLLVAGTMVLGIHNVVQFVGHFREHCAATAWVVNLVFFCITCPSYNLAEMYLLRMGRRTRQMMWLTLCSIILIYALFGVGYMTDTLINDRLPVASITSAAAAVATLTLLVQDYYLCRSFSSESKGMAMAERKERSQALKYTSFSMKCLMVSALLTPWSGMSSSLTFHAVFGLIMFVGMVWHLTNFVLYGRSLAVGGEDDADSSAVAQKKHSATAESTVVEGEEAMKGEALLEHITAKVDRWIGEKHYVDADLKMEKALEQMGLSMPRLAFYLDNVARVKGYRQWISMLRIEHAKAMMTENPNYTLDAIAEMSGFANRRSLTNVFKAQVGMSPGQWSIQQKESANDEKETANREKK